MSDMSLKNSTARFIRDLRVSDLSRWNWATHDKVLREDNVIIGIAVDCTGASLRVRLNEVGYNVDLESRDVLRPSKGMVLSSLRSPGRMRSGKMQFGNNCSVGEFMRMAAFLAIEGYL